MSFAIRDLISGLSCDDLQKLPPIPKEPLPSDCCGSGCRVCVNDLFNEEVEKWILSSNRILFGEKSDSNKATENGVPVLSKRKLTYFVIVDVTQESSDSFIYRFRHNDCNKNIGVLPGEYLVARVDCIDGGTVDREYTPITDVTAKGYFDILIKIYPHGKFTTIASKWKVGDYVQWKGPFGRFDYIANEHVNLVMIAGGTGITPFIPIVQNVVINEDDETRILLLYSSKTFEDILLKKRIDELQDYWNFKVVYFLTRVDDREKENAKFGYGDKFFYERISKDVLSRELSSLCIEKSKILICGSKEFQDTLCSATLGLGFPEERIKTF